MRAESLFSAFCRALQVAGFQWVVKFAWSPLWPAKTTPQHKRIDLLQLAFIKDDAEKLPYSLIDEFSFDIVIAFKGQKRLVSEENVNGFSGADDL